MVYNVQNKQAIVLHHQTGSTPERQTYLYFCQSLLLVVHLLDKPCVILCNFSKITHSNALRA